MQNAIDEVSGTVEMSSLIVLEAHVRDQGSGRLGLSITFLLVSDGLPEPGTSHGLSHAHISLTYLCVCKVLFMRAAIIICFNLNSSFKTPSANTVTLCNPGVRVEAYGF